MSPSPIVGHGPDGTSTDESYRFLDSKKILAFESRARSLYVFSKRKGNTNISPSEFENQLKTAVMELRKQNEELLRFSTKDIPLIMLITDPATYGSKFSSHVDNNNDEFTMIRNLLHKRGFADITRPEDYPTGHTINDMLESMGIDRLRGIAKVINPAALVRIDELSKERLINYINFKYNSFQSQSRDYIFDKVSAHDDVPDIVKEARTKPGVEEVSK
jgi:hypothetical protein